MKQNQAMQPLLTPESRSKTVDYPGLSHLAYGIGYLEQLLAILAEPLLIAGFSVAMIDFLSGGGLLALGVIKYAWAVTQAIAIDACFIVTWRRAFRAFADNHWLAGASYVLLGLLLGVVTWAAVDLQSLQQALGLGSAGALAHLSLTAETVTQLRSAVAVVMGVVVALSNHQVVSGAQAPAVRRTFLPLKRLLDTYLPESASLRVQVSSQQVQAEQKEELPEQVEPVHQSDHASPTRSSKPPRTQPTPLHVVSIDGGDLTPLERVREALETEPDASDRRIARLSSLSPTTVKKYRQLLAQQEVLTVQEGSQA
jgi:hypothetical protein